MLCLWRKVIASFIWLEDILFYHNLLAWGGSALSSVKACLESAVPASLLYLLCLTYHMYTLFVQKRCLYSTLSQLKKRCTTFVIRQCNTAGVPIPHASEVLLATHAYSGNIQPPWRSYRPLLCFDGNQIPFFKFSLNTCYIWFWGDST